MPLLVSFFLISLSFTQLGVLGVEVIDRSNCRFFLPSVLVRVKWDSSDSLLVAASHRLVLWLLKFPLPLWSCTDLEASGTVGVLSLTKGVLAILVIP